MFNLLKKLPHSFVEVLHYFPSPLEIYERSSVSMSLPPWQSHYFYCYCFKFIHSSRHVLVYYDCNVHFPQCIVMFSNFQEPIFSLSRFESSLPIFVYIFFVIYRIWKYFMTMCFICLNMFSKNRSLVHLIFL